MPRPPHRRQFIGQLAALATAGTAAPLLAQGEGQGRSTWDDSWFARLTAPHRAVFDSPSIDDGTVFFHVTGYQNAMKEIHNADAQAVIVIRHSAISIAFNDAMWEKYGLGKLTNQESATKNPYGAQLAAAHGRGVILLGCDLAARNQSGRIAAATGGDRAAVYADVKANLVPGMILQPTGVYAVHRAQEAKCTFIRSTV